MGLLFSVSVLITSSQNDMANMSPHSCDPPTDPQRLKIIDHLPFSL